MHASNHSQGSVVIAPFLGGLKILAWLISKWLFSINFPMHSAEFDTAWLCSNLLIIEWSNVQISLFVWVSLSHSITVGFADRVNFLFFANWKWKISCQPWVQVVCCPTDYANYTSTIFMGRCLRRLYTCFIIYVHHYRGIRPYNHPIHTATLLLQPIYSGSKFKEPL